MSAGAGKISSSLAKKAGKISSSFLIQPGKEGLTIDQEQSDNIPFEEVTPL